MKNPIRAVGVVLALAQASLASASEAHPASTSLFSWADVRWHDHMIELGAVQIPELLFLFAIGALFILLVTYSLSSYFGAKDLRRHLKKLAKSGNKWHIFRKEDVTEPDRDAVSKNKENGEETYPEIFPGAPQHPHFRLNKHRDSASGFLNRRAWLELVEEYARLESGVALVLIHADGFKEASSSSQIERQSNAMTLLSTRLRAALSGDVRIFHLDHHEFLLFFPKTTEKEVQTAVRVVGEVFLEILEQHDLPTAVHIGNSRISDQSVECSNILGLFQDAAFALLQRRSMGAYALDVG